MNPKLTQLVDEHMQSLHGMQEVGTDDFFYTKLKGRMLIRHKDGRKNLLLQDWGLPLKPVWIIGTLILLLLINSIMVRQQFTSKKAAATATVTTTDLQNFAESYDQNISSPF